MSIRHYLIPFFEIEWDRGGTIRILGLQLTLRACAVPRARGVWRRRQAQAWQRAGPPPREGYLPAAGERDAAPPRRQRLTPNSVNRGASAVGGTAAARRRGGAEEAVRGGLPAGSELAVEVAERGRAVAWRWSSRRSGTAASSSSIRRRGARRSQGVSSDSGDCRAIACEWMRGPGAATARAGNTMLPIVSPSALIRQPRLSAGSAGCTGSTHQNDAARAEGGACGVRSVAPKRRHRAGRAIYYSPRSATALPSSR